MVRLYAFAVSGVALLVSLGCSRQPLPANSAPAKDQAELEARFDRLEVGIPEREIAAFMGKAGAEVAGYSSRVLKTKPQSEGEMAAGDFDKHWASADWMAAIRVVFGPDGNAKRIQLLRLTPIGPVPRAPDESKGP